MIRTPADPRIENDEEQVPPPAPGAEGPPPGDARRDKQQQRKNRDELGVNDEHKTPEMEKGHRGTFP